MGLEPNTAIQDIKIDKVFIGSCTNGRIEDLREVAKIVKGKKVNKSVDAIVVPGSGLVKLQAEKEGLDKIFKDSGFDWREPGCSMCLILSFRGYLVVLLGLVFRYLSILRLFLQIWVFFGVLEFVGWGEFCFLVGLVIFCGDGLIFFLFWYVCMVRGEMLAYRGLFGVFLFLSWFFIRVGA